MKKVSSKMKILLVLVICGAMMVPAMASAAENDLLPGGQEYGIGDDTLNLTLTGEATELEFEVVNGNSGKKMVSSVKITLMAGKKKVVVISPDQFSQRKFSNAVGTLGEDIVNGLTEISVDIKVRGPKGGVIKLFATETYNGSTRPNGW